MSLSRACLEPRCSASESTLYLRQKLAYGVRTSHNVSYRLQQPFRVRQRAGKCIGESDLATRSFHFFHLTTQIQCHLQSGHKREPKTQNPPISLQHCYSNSPVLLPHTVTSCLLLSSSAEPTAPRRMLRSHSIQRLVQAYVWRSLGGYFGCGVFMYTMWQ